MKFIVAEKNFSQGRLLVITDKEVFDQKLEEGKVQLDLTSNFYKGVEKKQEEIEMLLGAAKHIHLTGEKVVALGIQLGYVDPRRIIRVKGVPHAEVVVDQ